MIRELRRRHLRVIGLLSILVPGVFVAAITARRPPSVMAVLPPELTGDGAQHPATIGQALIGTPSLGIHATLLADTSAAGRDIVLLRAEGASLPPDLLAYWAPAARKDSALPQDAELLGALDAGATVGLSLPPRARHGTGVLVVYSAADRRVTASGPLPEPAAPAGRP